MGKEELRKCNKCGEEKTLDQFYTYYRDKEKTMSYLRPDCKICFNRMSYRGKTRKRHNELMKGKSGATTRRRANYQYNRDQILRNVRKNANRFTKKEESALIEGDLSELMEKKSGKRKSKKPKNDKSGVTSTKRGRGVSRSKDVDS